MSNCSINSQIINDITLLVNTRYGNVDDSISLDQSGDSFTGKHGYLTLPKSTGTYLLPFSNGFAVWKSPVKLNVKAAYANKFYLRDGTAIGDDTKMLKEVKIGNDYYYIDQRFYDHAKDIKAALPYHTLAISSVDKTTTIEWFRCDDCIARNREQMIAWFNELPTTSKSTIKLQYTKYPKDAITDDVFKIATDKGWIISFA